MASSNDYIRVQPTKLTRAAHQFHNKIIQYDFNLIAMIWQSLDPTPSFQKRLEVIYERPLKKYSKKYTVKIFPQKKFFMQ